MRGELNPLNIVLDGGSCKYCSGKDITEGQWEVDPVTKEVFHVECKREAAFCYNPAGDVIDDSLVVSDHTRKMMDKMATETIVIQTANEEEAERAITKASGPRMGVIAAGGISQSIAKAVARRSANAKIQGTHIPRLASNESGELNESRKSIKRGVADTMHEAQREYLSTKLYGQEQQNKE